MSTLRQLMQLVKPYTKWMLLSALLGFLTAGSGIGLMMTSAYLIAKAALHPSIAELQIAIVGVRFFGISRGIFRYLERIVSHNTTFHILKKLRVWFYKSLEPLTPARILYTKKSDLFSRIINDIEELQNIYIRVLAPPMVALATMILIGILFGQFSWLYAFILFVFQFISAFIIPYFAYRLSKGLGSQIIQLKAMLNHFIMDGVQGIEELLAFNQFEKHHNKLANAHNKLMKIQRRMHLLKQMHEHFIGLLMFLSVVTMLIVVIPHVNNDELTGIYLAVLILGIMASFEPFIPLPEAAQHLESNMRSGERLFEIINAQPAVNFPKDGKPLPDIYDIHIKHLSFKYENSSKSENYVLNDINLNIPHGKMVAIVGPSGAGKSTLMHLLLRFWDIKQGIIQLSGIHWHEFTEDQIRNLWGIVSQHTYLFSGSLRENLLIGAPKATEKQLYNVIDEVALRTLVDRLPHGLDSYVGEQGLKLSGGERQRIALGRTLLRNNPLVMLDEPTANLDSLTEQKIFNHLFRFKGKKTLVMITHRLAGLDKADHIYLLNNGIIWESGKHHQLLKQNGLYAEMYRLQQAHEVIETIK
ncbi:MAG: thiol reductant ABC exporter subunit CydC [Caldithrix sp.]|nr:thiol reductant ABC exporter subunit CydC [Caldithrix sp.]